MNLTQFKDWALAQGSVAKYNDKQYKGECVSLINQYCYRVLGISAGAWGHAIDWATNSNVLSHFNKVSSPQAGDVLVYGTAYGTYGHIEIALGNGTSLQQNRNLDGRVSVLSTRTNYIAILRKKGTGDDMPIPDTDAYFARYDKLMLYVRGRHMTRDEFRKNIAGCNDLQAVERISDNPEADANYQFAVKGRQFDARVSELQTALKNEQNKPPKEIIKEVEKIVEKPVEVIKTIEVPTIANEKQVVESWLVKLWNSLFKS